MVQSTANLCWAADCPVVLVAAKVLEEFNVTNAARLTDVRFWEVFQL
jgi:hypothetical protein